MRQHACKSFAVPEFLVMLRTGTSCGPVAFRCNDSLNAECAVQPSLRSAAAISNEATARTMSPFFQTVARSKFVRNILPVPPGASKTNTFHFAEQYRL